MSQNRYVFERGPIRQRGAALIVGLVLLAVVTLVGVGAMQSTTLQEKMAGNLRDSNLAFQAAEAALRNCEGIPVQDYNAQVALFNSGTVATPPIARPPDTAWSRLNPVNGLPVVPAETVWIWSLDEDQTGALFPGLAGNRVDVTPGNNRFWWVERNGNWWQDVASNSQALPDNTLDGLVAQPRCILENYAYVDNDTSLTAQQFRQNPSRYPDGLVDEVVDGFIRQTSYYRVTARGQGGSGTAATLLQTGVYLVYFIPKS